MTRNDSVDAIEKDALSASEGVEEPASPAALPPEPLAHPRAIELPTREPAAAEFRSLDPKVMRLQQTVGWIIWGVIALPTLFAVVPVVVFAPLMGWAKALLGLGWLLVMGSLALFVARWPKVEHRHARYRVDGQGIEIQHGVFWRRAIRVPRSRVQHLDVTQGPIERGLGLGTLVLFTAGTDHARVDLSGLSYATALELRDRLLPGEGDDAV
jgi:membrane protein YdbS with pleckstrin-like domain